MQSASSELVGREQELERLLTSLAEADGGVARAVALVGEPGIGKSRLVAELIARMGDGLALLGRAAEFERDYPFGVFVDALDAYLGSVGQARLRGLDELAGVFPSLAGEATAPAALKEERYRTHAAVGSLLERLGGGRPWVLALDDVHWADGASLELIAHLLRRPPQARFLLVLALRPAQTPQRLLAALDAAERDGSCARVELSPLRRAEATTLLAGVPEGPLREELYVESGGNPFYLEQLARTTSSDAPPAEGLADVPDQVRRALASELAELADEARLVLDAAAVAGEPFGADFVAELAGVERTAVLDAIDAALGTGLLRRSETPGWFGFRHPIVRRAVYSSIGERARAETHARAADLLAGQGATALVRAHHVECSAAVGDGAGLAVLTEAGWQSSALAPAAAAHWFDAALRLLPPGADAGQRMGLLAPLAMSLTASGRLADGLERLHELLALVPPEQELVRAKAVTAMALIERLVGEGSEARAMLRGALDSLADPRSAEAAALQLELASDRYFSADWAGMAEWAAGACALAREVGDASLLAAAAAVLGLAELSVGDPAKARSLLAEAEGLIDGAADAELATHLGAAHWVGWLEHHLEHFPDVVRHYERGLALSRSTGQSHLLVPIMLGLAISRTWLGALPHAAEDADAAVEAAHLIGAPALLAITSSLRCWVAVRGGGLHEAMRAAETHVRAVTPSEVPQELLAAAWFGEALMESGSPGPGREEILRAGGGPELALLEPSQRPYYFEVLVRAELALGNLDAAHRWADETRALAERLGLVGARTWASRGAAECALAGGDSAAAAGLAQAAVETAGEVHPVERERSRIVYGRALAALGETDDAIRELEEARMQLASWSADRLAELAARELRKLGRRVGKAGTRAQGKDGLSALSARELEVARLVTDRLTNREIAERLVLSQKTVERHMDHIFRKLGVSSRVDVARAVEASETRV